MTEEDTSFDPDIDFCFMRYFVRMGEFTGTKEEIAEKQAKLRANYHAWRDRDKTGEAAN